MNSRSLRFRITAWYSGLLVSSAYGAEIKVSSEEGHGSRFTVELPLLEIPESELARPVLRTH